MSAPKAKSRLMIEKLTLHNFKSYAGLKCIGPFGKKFSAVVGPNGSGKSNVIDALQFVFGRRANKLRLKKVSQLIHSSTEHPNCESCRVTVHFQHITDTEDNEDGFEVVDGSKFTVAREATQDNKSKYFYNDSSSSYTEVTTLLRDQGIDLDNNRFLILQGEVEQIALMKPKAQNQFEVGLLEYLEDLIGSNIYVEPIEEQAAEVRKFDEERTFSLKKAVSTEKAKEELEGSKVEAEAYLQKERDLCRYNATQAQIIIRDAVAANSQTNSDFETLVANQEREKARMAEKEAEVTKIKSEYETISAEHEEISNAVEECAKEWSAFERKDVKYREDMKNAKQQIKKAERSLKTSAKQRTAAEQEREGYMKRLPGLQENIPVLRESLAAAEQKVEELFEANKGKTAGLRGELKQKQKELKKVRSQLDKSQAAYDEAVAGLQIFQKRAHAAANELAQVFSELEAMQKRIGGLEAEEARIIAAIKETKVKIQNVDAAIAKNSKDEQAAIKKAGKLEAEIEKGQAAAAASGSSSKIVQALMHAARKGGPLAKAGLHGRLGDLGAIDDKYDVAITTACPALNHFVVETTSGGQACVEYMRKHNLGVSTFIILNKITGAAADMKRSWKNVPGTKRLFDLVNIPNDKLRPAFYHALRNTLVAPTLDDGMKVAYHKGRVVHRVVSLDGQIIERNGTMSGGGSRAALGGGMKAQVYDAAAEQRLQDATSALQGVSEKIASLRSECAELKRQRRDFVKQCDKLETTLDKLQIERKSLPEQLQELEQRHSDLQESVKPMTKAEKGEEARLQAEADTAEQECAAAKATAEKVEAAIADVKERIVNAGGEEMKAAKRAATQAQKALDDTVAEVSSAEARVKACDKKLAACAKKEEALNADIAEATETRETIRTQMEAMDSAVKDLLARRESAKKELKAKEKVLKKIEKTFTGVVQDVEKIKLVLIDIENTVEEYNQVMKKNQNVIDHWNGVISDLQEKYKQNLTPANTQSASASEAEDNEDDVEAETQDPPTLELLSEAELSKFVKEDVQYKITMLEEERNALREKVDLSAIAEYYAKDAEYRKRMGELDEITKQRDAARAKYDALRKKRLAMFSEGFFTIKMKLKEMYRMLTLGGDAELEQVDTLDPFSEGILFSVRPPRKSWKSISNLSGGEKTLCSLALVFALHHYRPTPLYVMDEIDAALDFKNVSIIANYIKDRTKDAQFIVISLRNNMFELADRLVGIYKTNNATKSVTINPKAMANALSDSTNATTVSQ